MSNRELQCKVCNLGCRLNIKKINNDYIVEGYRCNRGLEFGKKSVQEPDRIITGRALLKNGPMGRAPVKSTDVIPSHLVDEAMEIIKNTVVIAPVNKGDIIIKNILNTGVDIVAQRRINELTFLRVG